MSNKQIESSIDAQKNEVTTVLNKVFTLIQKIGVKNVDSELSQLEDKLDNSYDSQRTNIIISITCSHYNTSLRQLKEEPRKNGESSDARAICYYLINKFTKRFLADISPIFDRDVSRISREIKRIRELNPRINKGTLNKLTEIENELKALALFNKQ